MPELGMCKSRALWSVKPVWVRDKVWEEEDRRGSSCNMSMWSMQVEIEGAWAGQKVGSGEGDTGEKNGVRAAVKRVDLRVVPSQSAWKSPARVISVVGYSAGNLDKKARASW
jgi:hypothetical protein